MKDQTKLLTDSENDFYEDEEQLNPERCTQHPVLAVFDAEALIFGANEYCRNNVSNTGRTCQH